MKDHWICLTIGFWISICIQKNMGSILFCLIFLLYLMFRTKRKIVYGLWILIWLYSQCILGMGFVSQSSSSFYKVIEIKDTYVIATSSHHRILIYGLEDPVFDDIYHVEHLEPIQALQNKDLFNFKKMMNRKGIYQYTNEKDVEKVSSSTSIRSKIYRSIKKKKQASYYLSYFYGIHTDSIATMILTLGYPLLAVIHLFKTRLYRYFSFQTAHIITIICCIFYGSFFVYPVSLVRYLLFSFAKILFKDWKSQWCLGCFLFLSLFPSKALDFVFILPTSFLFFGHFLEDPIQKKCSSLFLILIFQWLYFHKVNFISLLFFQLFRKIYALLFFIGILSLFLPFFDTWFVGGIDLYMRCLQAVPNFEWHYVPNIVFLSFVCVLIYKFLSHQHWKVCFLICMLIPFLSPYTSIFFDVYMFDIGQGDCTLIIEPFHRSSILIDCGQNLYRDNMESIVLPFLQAHQIRHLDAVILTHDDFDHSGGIETLKKHISIGTIIKDRESKVPVQYPFYSLLVKRDAKDENDESIVNFFSYDGFSYLWTGDISVDIEEELLYQYDLSKVNVLKLAHHGSNTSSSFDFLYEVDPDVALISVGSRNRYGHPSKSVIRSLDNLGIDTLMTKEHGMIHIRSFPGVLFFSTGSGLFGIIQSVI